MVTFAVILCLLIASLIVFINTDVPRWSIAIGLVVLAGSIPPLIDPFTRTFWTAIDIAMRPLEAFEVDWVVVDPEALTDQAGTSAGAPQGSTFGDTAPTPADPDAPDKID